MTDQSTLDAAVRDAVSMLDSGHMGKAVAILQSVCDEQNVNPEHWFILGTALADSGALVGADLAFRRALELHPGYLQAQARLGKVLIDQGKFADAIEPLQQVLAINPTYKSARIGLINALTRLRRFEEAENYCYLEDEDELFSAEMHIQLGIIRLQQGRLKAAITLFDQALATKPGSIKALLNKGLALQAAGRLDAAIDQFRYVTYKVPGLEAAWGYLGLTLLTKGDIEQAALCWEKSFKLNPANTRAGHQLASVYRHMCRTNDAADVYRRILKMHPDDVQARFFLDAYRIQESGGQPERIPADYVQAIYSGRNTGRALDASLTRSLEYRAPVVLNEMVREVCKVPDAGLDILEVGCGTGLCGSQFADISHCLVGTDLSAELLAVAREKHAYDNLFVADLVDVLSDNPDSFDLVIAMDVLCFFGELTDIFRKCYKTLRKAGVFAFSVGKPETAALWELHPYGHFVHSFKYLQEVAKVAGFEECCSKEITLRREMNEDRVGYVCLFRRS